MSEKMYDAVIVGAGIAGALVANELAKAGKSVLILEAGLGTGLKKNGYREFSKRYFSEHIRVPNSPYKHSTSAPAPSVLDIYDWYKTPYYEYNGEQKYGSNYTRAAGGTTLHWLGTCLRMLPNDFKMKTKYGVGADWPLSYWDLKPYYEKAEWEIGVSANKDEQEVLPNEKIFGDNYEYPMSKIPNSYLDDELGKHINGLKIKLGKIEHKLKVTGTPAGRNSIPNKAIDPRHPENGNILYRAVGSPDNPDEEGQRCQGNSSCVPICPIHAKYTALKTLSAGLNQPNSHLEIITQAIVTEIKSDAKTGKITKVAYKKYFESDKAWSEEHDPICEAKGRMFIIAANAIENTKLLLASNVANSSGLVGKFLMDHPYVLTWGTMPNNVGSYRGPGSTAGIPQIRDGKFRSEHAAFRVEIGNLGWLWPLVAPYSSLDENVDTKNLFGKDLKNELSKGKSRFRFGFGLEQLPDIENSVTINKKHLDASGNYRPIINYKISDYTRKGMIEAKKVSYKIFDKIIGAKEETNHTPVDKNDPRFMDFEGEHIMFEGAGHAAGTHRMGDSHSNSVVNSYQQSWDHENLFLIGCGSFCTVGTSNPTLTMAALTLRSSEKIIELLNVDKQS